MAAKTVEQIAAETLKIRLDMRTLMQEQGLSENEALARLLPNDRNRTKKLKRWKEKALWPVTESELSEQAAPPENAVIHRSQIETAAQPESGSALLVHSAIQCQSSQDTDAELLRRIRNMLDTIEPAERPVGATAKGRPSPLKTIMIAIRIPTSLDDELKALGGLKSRHVEKAIMLYLRAMNAGEGADD